MATQSANKKKSTAKTTNSSAKKNTVSGKKNTQNSYYKSKAKKAESNPEILSEVYVILVLAFAVALFLSNFGVIGPFGDFISSIMFGIFGLLAYIFPILLFAGVAFGISNYGNRVANIKLISGIILFIIIGIFCEMTTGVVKELTTADQFLRSIYMNSSDTHYGGGVIFGTMAYLLYHVLGALGTYLLLAVITIICIIIITEKSLLKGVSTSSKKVYETAREDAITRKEKKEEIAQQREQERILRMDKKVVGVMLDTSLDQKEEPSFGTIRDDMHEIRVDNDENHITSQKLSSREQDNLAFENIRVHPLNKENLNIIPDPVFEGKNRTAGSDEIKAIRPNEGNTPSGVKISYEKSKTSTASENTPVSEKEIITEITTGQSVTPKKYHFPSINLLKQGEKGNKVDPTKELKETALRLQQTLSTFGVKVTITDISQGPAVTRYELQPEQGVKVSRIVNLQDDIKLNLAATDIRIEAPIPGKAAVGIEVPNKENTTVVLRDLLDSKEFKDFPSNIAFAVGKDISGQIIVSDIGKMPHMLIAGATGSGKSVCINTLIMSILYKAHPDDVKLIMIDPKVVELSVYNGIPHLLIPVVTDPKKAAGALHWGVAEMTERYKKFADLNVRDLKGYNKQVETLPPDNSPDAPKKMPQIVIIVDELADLMMVAPGEVEESICRLAQLARAAGIHLIIATQRPSVDVITGLIKANMPSRVAFSVSSGVDSRTILDMNGAEKLLGKGDMLFYPQGYAKPARIQGAFVTDKEILDVVDFLKNQVIGNVYNQEIQEKITSIGGQGSQNNNGFDGGSERDSYFTEAGRFFIERDKASIGMLQRVLKIGFNRAARIMDQLEEAGVVGAEEGTKPRKVLMTMEEFKEIIEEE